MKQTGTSIKSSWGTSNKPSDTFTETNGSMSRRNTSAPYSSNTNTPQGTIHTQWWNQENGLTMQAACR